MSGIDQSYYSGDDDGDSEDGGSSGEPSDGGSPPGRVFPPRISSTPTPPTGTSPGILPPGASSPGPGPSVAPPITTSPGIMPPGASSSGPGPSVAPPTRASSETTRTSPAATMPGSTAAPSRGTSTVPSTRHPTTTPSTTTGFPKYRELVCTVGADAVLGKQYPADGLCDYLYYTDVVIVNLTLYATKVQTSWAFFQKHMKTMSKTSGGIAFDVRYLTLDRFRHPNTIRQLNALATNNVRHYGLLNILTQLAALKPLLDNAKALLEEMKKIQGNDTSRKAIIALGLFNYSQPNAWRDYVDLFKKAVNEYQADTVFSISSSGLLESEQNCICLPPSVIYSPDPAYPSFDRHRQLTSPDFHYDKASAVVGLTFQLGVLTYVLEKATTSLRQSINDLGRVQYQKCASAGMADAGLGCDSEVWRQKLHDWGTVGYVFPLDNRHIYISESHHGAFHKVKHILNGSRHRISLLAFNVHLEFLRSNQCRPKFQYLQDLRDGLNKY